MKKGSEYTELGAVVVSLLRERGISQRQFAKKIDLSPESLRRYFKQGDAPKLENLEAIEDGLNLPRGSLRRFWKSEAEIDQDSIRHAEGALRDLFSSYGVSEEHRAGVVRSSPIGGDQMYTDMRSFLDGPEFQRLSRDHKLGLALLLRGREVKPLRVLAALELLGIAAPEQEPQKAAHKKRAR